MIRRFNRFELKYIIPVALRDALIEDMAHQMTTDAHGDAKGWYRVSSLYFDSPDDTCFRSKIEGIKYRRKVRIRTYGAYVESPSELVSLEIKQRINRTVQKRRALLSMEDSLALVSRTSRPEVATAEDRAVVEEVELLSRALQLRPACVISYLRQAWVGSDYESGLRITFDQNLSVRGPERDLRSGLEELLFMPDDWLIMEVKVNEAVPIWVTRMLSRHQCSLDRISKYCTGLALLRRTDRTRERHGGAEWTSF